MIGGMGCLDGFAIELVRADDFGCKSGWDLIGWIMCMRLSEVLDIGDVNQTLTITSYRYTALVAHISSGSWHRLAMVPFPTG